MRRFLSGAPSPQNVVFDDLDNLNRVIARSKG